MNISVRNNFEEEGHSFQANCHKRKSIFHIFLS